MLTIHDYPPVLARRLRVRRPDADLVGHDRSPGAFVVYLFLLHSAQTLGRDQVPASLQAIAVKTGLSKSAVQVTLRHLKRRGLIGAEEVGTQVNPVRHVLRPWRRRLEVVA